jgi:hypothetical protein
MLFSLMLGLPPISPETTMASHEYVRNGHIISIDVDDDTSGKWTWSYTIDGGGYTDLRDRRLKSESAARREAEHDANNKADRMAAGDIVE